MGIKINDKSTLFLLAFLSVIISYIFFSNYFKNQIHTKYQYNIVVIEKVESLGKSGWRTEFSYFKDEKEYLGRHYIIKDSVRYYESQIGKKYLVKMSDKQWVNRFFYTYKLYMDKPVPDSIEAPNEGWKELPNWAK